ncbi:acid protease [Sistotremastrum niveocremeum HHB9708]|uniref:Acid protease n=1 Tax=Sistotremastrum niveocremeum HHB9708 TaxID=1314777 RepID=A0A164Z2H8_9AGAM|nr:acid protease [Sistotremastrum niveocremeum HHB9708]
MFWLPWITILTGQILVEARLFSRDTVVGTLTVPLALDSNRRYLAQVTMGSIGTPQIFNFTLSTTMGYSIVAMSGCSNCLAQKEYNSSQSGSEKNLGRNQTLSVAGSFVTGTLIKEDCTLAEVNGSAWNYPNQTLTSSNQTSQQFFSAEASGVFGLGLTGPNLTFRDTLYGGFFSENPDLNNFTYGMALNPPYSNKNEATAQNQSTGGFLHWEFPDSSAYTGPVTQLSVKNGSEVAGPGAPIQQTPLAASGDWTIQLDGWSSEVNDSQTIHSAPNWATLDPYFPDIYLSKNEADLIYAAIPGSSASDEGTFTRWTIPCETQLTWTVSVQSTPFTVPSSTLVIQNGTSCVGAIVGWTSPNSTTYLLGSSFISAVYMIFSVGVPGDQPTTVGMAARSPLTLKTSNVGIIVGGTIGGTAVVVVILFMIWFMFFKHGCTGPKGGSMSHIRDIDAFSIPQNEMVTPFTSSSLSFGSMYKQGVMNDKGENPVYLPPTPVSSNSVIYGQSSENDSVRLTNSPHTIQHSTQKGPQLTVTNMNSDPSGDAETTGTIGLEISDNDDGHGAEPFDIDGGDILVAGTPRSTIETEWMVEPFYIPAQRTNENQPPRKGPAPEAMTSSSLHTATATPATADQHPFPAHTEPSPTQTLVQPIIGDAPARGRGKN